MKKDVTYHPSTESYDKIRDELDKLGYPVVTYGPGFYSYHSKRYDMISPYFMFDDRIEPWKKMSLINTLQQLTFGSNVSWGVVNIEPDDGALLDTITLINMESMVIGVEYDQIRQADDEGDGLWEDPVRACREIDAMNSKLEKTMHQLIERLGGKKR